MLSRIQMQANRRNRTRNERHSGAKRPWRDRLFVSLGVAAALLSGTPRADGRQAETLAGRHLIADDAEVWQVQSDTGALRMIDGEDGQRQIAFVALATPEHLAGRDVALLPCDLGTRPFDLTVDVIVDRRSGPDVFIPGLIVGLSPVHPYEMEADDLAVMATLHFRGLYAGVRRGPPYALRPRTADVLTPSYTQLVGGRPYPAEPYSRAARGTFGTGNPIRLRIRRDARNILTFVAWCPSAGETAAAPWWQGAWEIPEEHADMPLRMVFIKRIPIYSVHLGAENQGYGDLIQLSGGVANMTLSLDPPAISTVSWSGLTVEAGNTLAIGGAGFAANATVEIGGQPAAVVRRVSDSELHARMPALPTGRRYSLIVANPDGAPAEAPRAIPLGRMLETISLSDGSPAGGDVAILTGSGFASDGPQATVVRFGETRAEHLERIDARTLKVRVPEGAPGSVAVTAATADGIPFAGALRFGYTPRPTLFQTAAEREAWRLRTQKPPWKHYREAILQAAVKPLARAPFSPHVPVDPYLSALPWIYAMTGETSHRDALINWSEAILQRGDTDRRQGAFLAGAYDALGTAMSTELRSRILARLHDMLDAYVVDEANGDWHVVNPSWTNPQENCAAVIMALTLRHAREDSASILDAATGHLRTFIETAMGPDGGWIDGFSWGAGALNDYLQAACLLAKHRADRSLLDHPRLNNMARMYQATLATPTRVTRFGDTHDGLAGVVPASEIGSRTNDALLLWAADTAAARAGWEAAGRVAFALFRRSDAPLRTTPPPVPAVAALHDMHWGVMRSEPLVQATIVVGVSGRDGVLPYHRQHDVAGFQLYAHGEELVVDPGWGSRAPEEHSLPVIDGVAGDAWGGRIGDTQEHGPWRALVVDAGRNRAPWGVRRFRRTFVLHRDGTLVVLDDIVPAAGQPGRVRSRFQVPEANLSPDRTSATVVGEKASLTFRFFGPEATLDTEERRRGRHWTGTWQSLCVDYTAQASRPLVAVARIGEGTAPPLIGEAVAFTDDTIVIEVTPEDSLRFRLTDEGWALVRPDGDGQRTLLTPTPLPERPVAICIRADQPPTIDGVLDDEVWQKAKPTAGFVELNTWRDPPTARFASEARFAYDDTHLYAAFRAYETDLADIVVSTEGPALGAGGDHLIVYLDPERERVGNRFYGCVLTADGRDLGVYGKVGDIGGSALNVAAGREPANDRGPGAWTLEVAWPWETVLHDPWDRLNMVGPPAPGHRMGLNIQRYRWSAPREISVWAPAFDAPAALPWRWGELWFE